MRESYQTWNSMKWFDKNVSVSTAAQLQKYGGSVGKRYLDKLPKTENVANM